MRSITRRKMVAIALVLATLTLLLSWYPTGASQDNTSVRAIVAKSETDASTRFIDVAIDDSGGLRLEGKTVTLKEFAALIAEIASMDKNNTVVNLDCSNHMPMGMLFEVQKILQKADLTKVSYKSNVGKALPLVLPSEKIKLRIKDIPPSDIANLTIDESGSVQINNQNIPMSDIKNNVKRLTEQNEFVIVSMHIAAGTSYEDFVRVLDQTKKGGATRILINDAK